MTTQRRGREDWTGTLPELLVYQELLRQGLQPGIDFFYQFSIFGGRTERGGAVLDFFFIEPPGLAINVQGEYWHYQRGVQHRALDRLRKAQLAGQGITLIYIDAIAAETRTRWVVTQALKFQDHSGMHVGSSL